ncbi:MAG: hypothetical protein Q9187_007775, partial [Circinaria calcarea]
AYNGMPMGQVFNNASDLANAPGVARSLIAMQERLSTLEATLNNGGVPLEDDIYQAQLQFDELWRQQPLLQGRPGTLLQTQLLNIMLRASQARRRSHNSSNPTPEVSTAPSFVPQPTMQASSMVYLLSSPSGPQALLISPSGTMYASPGLNTVQAGIPFGLQAQQRLGRQIRLVNPASNINVQSRPPPQNDQVVEQQQQQPQVNEARDLVRILLPLGGHLWLLIRLFGFVYFFTGGTGWRRTILLGICALTVFIAQTGVFRPLQQAIWDPLRRHVEGLVPLGAHAAPRADVNREEIEGQRRGGARPDPRDMADRLLQQRDSRDGSILRRNLRRAERATALFVASLVPGVGERHIAARDAAEAARLAEEREREERLRREVETSTQEVAIAATEEHGEDIFSDAQEDTGAGSGQVSQENVVAPAT